MCGGGGEVEVVRQESERVGVFVSVCMRERADRKEGESSVSYI